MSRGRLRTVRPPSDQDPDGDPDPRRARSRPPVERATGPEVLPDWTRFNIQHSLKALRSSDPKVIIKELRKLHLSWLHAKEPNMR